MLEERLIAEQIPQGTYQLLDKDVVLDIIVRFEPRMDRKGNEGLSPRAGMSISDMEPAAVAAWIEEIGVPTQDRVNVCWLSLREGVVIVLKDFVARYDDLWYPAADDVWISDLSDRWLLELSHEEELTLWRAD